MRAVSSFNASDDDVDPRLLRLWEALEVSDSAECSGEGGNRDVDGFDGAFERAPRGLRDLAGNTAGESSWGGTSKTANLASGSLERIGTASFAKESGVGFALFC